MYIDVEKLMHGDWVCTEQDSTPRQIDWIRTGEVGLFWNKVATPPSLVSILLTPEILEKNGFRKLVTYGTEKWVCNNLRLNVYSSDGTWRFCADTNRNENSVIYIRFVHELQHALKLCGTEKEIEL